MKVKFKKLHPSARVPEYKTSGAAGADVFALLPDGAAVYELPPGMACLAGTGIAMEIPVGYEGQIRPRSSLALKHGVTVLNSPGTLDSDYRGEVKVLLMNHGASPFFIYPGDRIAQLVFQPVQQAPFDEVEELSETKRGEGGFGSTGK